MLFVLLAVASPPDPTFQYFTGTVQHVLDGKPVSATTTLKRTLTYATKTIVEEQTWDWSVGSHEVETRTFSVTDETASLIVRIGDEEDKGTAALKGVPWSWNEWSWTVTTPAEKGAGTISERCTSANGAKLACTRTIVTRGDAPRTLTMKSKLTRISQQAYEKAKR